MAIGYLIDRGDNSMNVRIVIAGAALLGLAMCATAWAGDDPEVERAKLAGKWEMKSEGAADKAPVWVVEDKGTSIHIMRLVGAEKVSDFECDLGKECKVKDSGKSVTEQIYFNGPKLVEIETKGSEVVKRRFETATEPDTMQVEVMPLVPSGKTETLVFKRAAK
jgi:hypothetical protein